jgi:hypothetical protein
MEEEEVVEEEDQDQGKDDDQGEDELGAGARTRWGPPASGRRACRE